MNLIKEEKGEERMKKLLLFVLLIFVMAILSCSGWDRGKCYDSAQKAFPEGRVVVIDETGWRFIVKDKDGSIWYVVAGNDTNSDITEKRKLF